MPFRHVRSGISICLKNAGFDGFRVLLFKDSDGIKAASGEPGLKFTVDFGLGMLNAMHLGDVINDMVYQIRPFEVNKGETDAFSARWWTASAKIFATVNRSKSRAAPNWLKPKVKNNKILRNTSTCWARCTSTYGARITSKPCTLPATA